ncbi:MAG TPA: DinB family protein [Hymenobacter sp.]
MPAVVRATTDYFDQLTNDLLVLRVVAQQRFRPLSAEELNRRPGPSRWSAGQCLEHLNIVGGYYLPSIARRIAQAQARGSKPTATIKQGYFGGRFVNAMRAPVSAKAYTTPQRYAPTGTRLPRTVAEVFSRQIDELLRLVLLARQVNANAVLIPNAVFPFLFLRLADQLELLIVHIQRHVAQAETVLAGHGIGARASAA